MMRDKRHPIKTNPNEQISRAAMATKEPSAKKLKMHPSAVLAFCVSLSVDV